MRTKLMLITISLFLITPLFGLPDEEILDNYNKGRSILYKDKKTQDQIAESFYYYKPLRDDSSYAFHSPLHIFIEGGFGALESRTLVGFAFRQSFSNVMDRLLNPISTINKYGWGNFVWDEFIPHWGDDSVQFVPNYVWHIIGGGMRFKLMEEYFRYHDYSNPYLASFLTLTAMNFMNEWIEAGMEYYTVDHIADIVFFDIFAKIIFSFDSVNYVFTKYLHLSEWTYLTEIDITSSRLTNTGQLYWVRLNFFETMFNLFALTGEPVSTVGVSLEITKGHFVSVGVGARPVSLISDDKGRVGAEHITMQFGLFYSIDDAPYLTISYEPEMKVTPEDPTKIGEYSRRLVINLYPGPLEISGVKLGLTFQYFKGAFFLGITSGSWPMGAIFGTPVDDAYLNSY